jgi:hypothetical protein
MASGALRQISVGNRTTLTPGIKRCPKNLTLEQDLKCAEQAADSHGSSSLRRITTIMYWVHGRSDGEQMRFWAKTEKEILVDNYVRLDVHAPSKYAIWLQNGRLRIYFNGQKAGDYNQLELPDFDSASLLVNDFKEGPLSLMRVRFAESTPDSAKSSCRMGST